MVKMDYKDLCGLVPSRDVGLGSPSSPSDLVDSSENEMDPSNDCATPRSDGRGSSSGSDGNGGRSVNTSSRRRRLMPSSPTGTQLMSEFNAAGDAGGSGSSSSPPSSGALDLEALPTPNQVRRLRLVPTDNTIIMEGELLDDDNEPSTPSGTRRSASLVDNSGLDTSAIARRSTSVGNNGPRPSNRVSISDLDLVLVSSGSQGSSEGGSGGRRSASNDQFPQMEEHRGMQAPRNNRHFEVGSSSRQPEPGQWHPPSIQIQPQQGPQSPYPFNIHLAPDFHIPPNMNFHLLQVGPECPVPVPPPTPPAWGLLPGFPAGLRVEPGFQGRVLLPHYAYGPPAPSVYPPFEVTTGSPPLEVFTARRSSGLYPPPGVTIRAPPTSSGDPPPLPEQPVRTRVTITAPPASEGGASSAPSRQPEATPPEQAVPSRVTIKAPPAGEGTSSSPPKQPEATLLAPKPEEPETGPPQSVPVPRWPTFTWPPTEAEDALFTERLHGPSRRPRLPVFQEICPDDGTSQPPSPPTSPPPPPPPPPTSQPPPPPLPPPSPPPTPRSP